MKFAFVQKSDKIAQCLPVLKTEWHEKGNIIILIKMFLHANNFHASFVMNELELIMHMPQKCSNS